MNPNHAEELTNLAPNADIAPDALARVVDEVRAEAQISPDRYLNETIVPEGGE